MRIKVAVLEDDVAFREDILVSGLAQFDFDVEGFGSSAELHRRMREVSFELLVLDLRLEEEDGLEVARQLRKVSSMGIVTLTGRGTHKERVQGLTETVDAWLTKPVDLDVLAATLHGLSRRIRQHTGDAHLPKAAPKGWRLSQGNWRLIGPDGRSMPLNPLERSLLTRLTATPGDLVLHADLLSNLATTARGIHRQRLEVLIHRLRRKVESHFGQELPLKSVRGSGYLMVSVEEEGGDGGGSGENSPQQTK
jgi:DNA-binding response OmpR family regulator